MTINAFPFPVDANGEAKPRHALCWWVPLPDPIGLADGMELHFATSKPQAHLLNGTPDSSKAPPAHEYDITFLVQQVDVSWDQSPGELAAFQMAKLEQKPTGESVSVKKPGSHSEALIRRISIIRAAVSNATGVEFDSDSISSAFDTVIRQIRRVQASYSLVSQWPMTFAAREVLPMIIPFETFSPDAEENQERNLSLYHLHTNGLEQAATPEPLTDQQEQMLHIAIDRDHAAFASYHRLRHDALVSLRRRGDYRSSLLSSASAAEVYLDELLLHMMWEEGMRPEDAGETFADPRTGTIKRLKTEYVPRLHGIWNPTQSGPTQAWRDNIARVRNRTIHAGHEPGIREAELAYESLIDLERHGADLVAARNSKYPRTALAICGEEGLRRRGKFTQRIQRLMQDPSEPRWVETFVRWKSETMRERNRSDGFGEEPVVNRASLLMVGHQAGPDWVLHDPVAAMAARVTPDLSAFPEEQATGIESMLENLHDGVAHILDVHGFVPNEEWVGQHRRIPGLGTMVNWEDFY